MPRTIENHYTKMRPTVTIIKKNCTFEQGCVGAVIPDDKSSKSKKSCYHFSKTSEIEPFFFIDL